MKNEVNAKFDNLEHLMFPKFIEQLQNHGGEYKDVLAQNNAVSHSISFSNVGQFNTDYMKMFDGISVDEIYCSGTRWNNVIEYTFLFQSTKKMCITITHFDLEVYKTAAEKYLKTFLEICEDPEKFANMKLCEFVHCLE